MPSKKTAEPQPISSMEEGQSQRKLVFLLGIVSVLLYSTTFFNGFALDDYAVIVNNRIVTQGIATIPEIFTTPYLHGYVINPNDLYRPLSLAMFAIEYQLSGGSPMLSHIVNVAVYAACVICLFLFLDRLYERRKTALAFIASLLFALHPIHTEVVANIKSRDELLCFLFAFLSLNTFVSYIRLAHLARLLAGGAFLFLSLLSKETSLNFVILIPILFFLWERGNTRRGSHIMLATFAAIGIFFLIRLPILNAFNANHPLNVQMTENTLAGASSASERFATALLVLGKYIMLLLIPYPLISDYSYNSIPLTNFSNLWVWVSCISYIAILGIGIQRLVSKPKDNYSLGILVYLVPLALFSNIAFLVGATMAERFLFFPSVGFCIVIAEAISRLILKENSLAIKPKIYVVLVPIALVWGGLTINRSNDWKDNYTLFTRDMAKAGNNYRLPSYLGSFLINSSNTAPDTITRNQQLNEAIGYLKRAIAVYPAYQIPYAQLGQSYMNLNQFDSSRKYLQYALTLNSKDTFSRNNLSGIYFKEGRYQEAIALCRANLLIDSNYTRAYTNIGACFLKMGIPDSAIAPLRKAIQLEPDKKGYYYLSVAFQMSGNSDSAVKYQQLSQQASL